MSTGYRRARYLNISASAEDDWRHLGYHRAFDRIPRRFSRRGRPVADDLVLRDVVEGGLAILFDQQRDPDASHMAAFLSRDRSGWRAFLTHWTRILADPTVTVKTIVWGSQVVGSVGSFEWEGLAAPEEASSLRQRGWR